MNIQILSDLHLERFFDNDMLGAMLSALYTNNADIVILAGDTFSYYGVENQMKMVSKNFHDQKVVFIPGNHEYYYTSKKEMDEILKEESARYENMIFLENNYYINDDMVIIGGCGWHDNTTSKYFNYLNDFNYIEELRKNPSLSMEWNKETKEFFLKCLKCSKGFKDKKVICVTHNSPLLNFISPEYSTSHLTSFFINDWSDIINEFKPYMWISGHNHQAVTLKFGDTICVENSYGYNGNVKLFNPHYVVNTGD